MAQSPHWPTAIAIEGRTGRTALNNFTDQPPVIAELRDVNGLILEDLSHISGGNVIGRRIVSACSYVG